MQKVFRINLDISKKIITPTFEVNTNDLNSIKLLIRITDELKPLDLTGITPRLPVRKPDNKVVFQDCEVVDAKNGQIEAILENQAYIVAGTHTAEIMCYKENSLVAVTGTFSYKAKQGIMNDVALESKNEFTSITNMLKDVQETIDDIRENGTGIDTQARQDIESVTTQLADTSQKLNPTSTYNGAVITVIDDDGYSQFMNQWYVVCKNKGIRCSLGIYKNRVGKSDSLSLSQLQSLKSEGFDILSHSVSHADVPDVSESVWENECAESKEFITSNNLGTGEAIVYPVGFVDTVTHQQKEMVKRVTRKHYKYGIDALGGVNTLPVDSYEVKRQGISNKTFEEIKSYIDDAVAKKGWLIIITHSQIGTFNASLMEQWIDYAKSINVPILPFTEAEKLIGNSLSYGDSNTENYLFASKNGFLKNNDNFTYSSFSMDMSIENYPENKEIIKEISGLQDTLLNLGGTLKTYHSRQANQSYQIFFPSARNYFYKRDWNDTSKKWSEWFLSNGLVVKGNSSSSLISDPISSYTKNMITRVYLNSVQDTSFGTGGTLEVYRGAPHCSYALFYQAITGDIYKRQWVEGTSSWGNWSRVNPVPLSDSTSHNMDQPITNYTANAETTLLLDSASDIFKNTGGVMKVYRYTIGQDIYSYATFTPVGVSEMYIRKWSKSKSSWTAWTKMGA